MSTAGTTSKLRGIRGLQTDARYYEYPHS
jgi:hypothetical protein